MFTKSSNNKPAQPVTPSPTSSKPSNTETYTRIGEDVNFEGAINCSGDVRVDGNIKGNINTSSRVIVGRKGIINGNVICDSAEIEGIFNGNLKAKDLLSLKETADVKGDVELARLSISPGALFNVSSCKMAKGGSVTEMPKSTLTPEPTATSINSDSKK